MKKSPLELIQGKTIEYAEISKEEASDGCIYGKLMLEFSDGSSFEMEIYAMPKVIGAFYNSDQTTDPDADPTGEQQIELIDPSPC